MQRSSPTASSRREVLRGLAGAGLAWAAGGRVHAAEDVGAAPQREVPPPRDIPPMKITRAEPILTGGDVFVRIETDAGIVGYGDATNSFLPYSAEGMLRDLIPYLIGEDPQRIEYLWQSCFRRRFYRGGPSTGTAIAGIDQALWDIKGKACGMPVYQLLGGLARTSVRVYGHVGGNTAEEAARQAKDRVAKGITAIRFRAFHSYDAEDFHEHELAVRQQIEYLAAIREAVGDEVDLILECHGRYDPVWAIKLAKLAEPYHPFLIEDPIRHENPEALLRVREATDLPLAIGERYHNKWDCRETIVRQYVNYVRPDVSSLRRDQRDQEDRRDGRGLLHRPDSAQQRRSARFGGHAARRAGDPQHRDDRSRRGSTAAARATWSGRIRRWKTATRCPWRVPAWASPSTKSWPSPARSASRGCSRD